MTGEERERLMDFVKACLERCRHCGKSVPDPTIVSLAVPENEETGEGMVVISEIRLCYRCYSSLKDTVDLLEGIVMHT